VNRTDKQTAVDVLSRVFEHHSAIFALDFRKLKVDEATELRRKIRDCGGRYQVVKNTLALRALPGTAVEPLRKHLKGMTGLAYAESDPVALAKVLNDFAGAVPALSFKGGVVSGIELSGEEFKELATLPGKDELSARLLSVLEAPVRNFLSVVQASARDLVLVLKAALDERKKQ